MRLYYIANARMPTEKAHGIQIAKMCEAFVEGGKDVVLVVPRRRGDPRTLREFYNLRAEPKMVRLPALDWYTGGVFGYRLSSYTFMFSALVYLWARRCEGERFIAYTVDMDAFSSSFLPLVGVQIFSEMHGAKPRTLAQRFLFAFARGIIAINSLIVEELRMTFPRSKAHYTVEPNGVDISAFSAGDKKSARAELGVPQDARAVLYTGRFFAWKGLEILAAAAALSPEISWYIVGGTAEEFIRIARIPTVPSNMVFVGERPHADIPDWIAAADAVVVLGTKRDVQSYRYTSPMKLFEYLVSERPIVASNTPAIREIVSAEEVFLYEPDEPESLADAARSALAEEPEAQGRVRRARAKGLSFSWEHRAERILRFIAEHTL